MMPRSKPTETVVHRIEMGSWERERVEGLLDSMKFKQFSQPLIEAMKDVAPWLVLVGLLNAMGWGIILPTAIKKGAEGVKEIIDAISIAYAERKEQGLGFLSDLFDMFVREGPPVNPIDPERAAQMTSIYTNQAGPSTERPTSPADVWREYGQG
jgi:hypothetical protein